MDKLDVLLFGMTGFGNNAVNILETIDYIHLKGVLTNKKHVNQFPYYTCEKIHDLCSRKNINLYEGYSLKEKDTEDLINKIKPDLIFVSSFNQIIPSNIIAIPPYGVINLHPSLLPKYRGPTPVFWVLRNGEDETGITAHYIEDEGIDSGRIICQHRLAIDKSDNNGTLRIKLGDLVEKTLADALQRIISEDDLYVEQNETEASYNPKRTIDDAVIDVTYDVDVIQRIINAATPYPGALLKYKGTEFIVTAVEKISGSDCIDNSDQNKETICVKTDQYILKFNIKGASKK